MCNGEIIRDYQLNQSNQKLPLWEYLIWEFIQR